MFQLNERVAAWCQSVHPRGSDRDARIDELADHLFCEIARLTESGMSEEEAFLAATEQMGKADDLASEHEKNRGSLSKFGVVLLAMSCGNTAWLLRESVTRKQATALLLGVSLLTAAIMIGSALITKRSDQTVIWVLIAIWFVPFSALSPISDGTVRAGDGEEA